ncbi:hypothetical protein JOF56_011257 [Kibdelosporangium banguiense]|uniref:SURF1-like protein n=1 Tax=Kibdelosporangium banguiense TaxID=1365924 RepID=A0ABS4U2I9_9PSEU|nr:hypothetical protein [Kibdelosporangium banguiense]MBP2330872.1 hypothetical protein [Kibdelosporangium banguiense]
MTAILRAQSLGKKYKRKWALAGCTLDISGQVERIGVVDPKGVWRLGNETVDPAGNVITSLPAAIVDCMPKASRDSATVPDFRVIRSCLAKLDSLGYKQRLTYQPGDRFWPLQWLELGMFLVLSGLLTWFCFRLTRHRLS